MWILLNCHFQGQEITFLVDGGADSDSMKPKLVDQQAQPLPYNCLLPMTSCHGSKSRQLI